MSDYDEYRARMEEERAAMQTEPSVPGVAIDLVTRQALWIDSVAAEDVVEYAMDEGFDLSTYKSHPSLPVTLDDTVYTCYFISSDPNDGWKLGNDYAFPRGRLMTVPVPAPEADSTSTQSEGETDPSESDELGAFNPDAGIGGST